MTTDTPIACSLSAGDYRRRVADAGAVAQDALRSRRPIPGGARFIFERRDDVRIRLEELIAAESSCCPFLTMRLLPKAGDLALEVTGPPTAAPIIEELFALSAG